MTKKVCPHCKKKYNLGYNGVVEGCDKCLGIKRDKQGYAWFPHDRTHTFHPNDGAPDYTVTRQQAFGTDE